jgi:hypothetical protein
LFYELAVMQAEIAVKVDGQLVTMHVERVDGTLVVSPI